MSVTSPLPIGTRQAAERLGVATWCVRRVYARQLLEDAPRIGRTRVLSESDLPKLKAALVVAGYLAPDPPARG